MTDPQNLMFDDELKEKFFKESVEAGTMTQEKADEINKMIHELFDVFER